VAGEWIDRTIRGPAADFLTADEFGRLFGLGADTIRRLVDEGEIPPPIRLSAKTHLFPWESVVLFSLRLKVAQVTPEGEEPVKKNPGGK
jgi:predicted DNA-binding transcriptional regulator AlpA